MALGLRQDLRLTQKLLLTPQLRLAIKLLQLSRLDLMDVIKEELEQNPVLEEVSGATADVEPECDAAPSEPSAAAEEELWQNYLGDSGDDSSRAINFNDNDEETFYEKASVVGTDLRDYLTWQIHYTFVGDKEKSIAETVICNIDDDGFLRAFDRGEMGDDELREKTAEVIAEEAGCTAQEAAAMIEKIQALDPPGVAAVTTKECLLLQARRLPARDPLMEDIIERHLELLGKKNYSAIAGTLGVTPGEVEETAKNIAELLTPVPGSGFGTGEDRAIIPDVYVQKVGGEYSVFLNDDGLPMLRISPYYKELLKNKKLSGSEEKNFVQERFNSAAWLIKSVQQRQRTLRRVAESIVKFQTEFLEHGLKFLKPLVLKDVAADIGMHESTISRVTTSKYMHTPRGIFELKYFFSTSMSSGEGESVSTEYVKERLKSLIEAEDERSPLSDQQLVEMLKSSGMELARRTVAKYREELGFLSSSGRKVR